MHDLPPANETVLEVISPDRSRQFVRVTETPFLIGRGGEIGNHLQLTDRRISRLCAAIVSEGGRYHLEDRGQRTGVFVNGKKIEGRALEDGNVITFGLEDSYEIIFRCSTADTSIQKLLNRMESLSSMDSSPGSLSKLNLLLEATMLLHSQLPLDSVLESMLAHAIAITNADRGLLLEPDSSGSLHVRLARSSGGVRLPAEGLTPSQTALRLALKQQSSVITEDLAQADFKLQDAQSIVAQRLRAIVTIPLYSTSSSGSEQTGLGVDQKDVLGMVYLDSRRPAAFSRLERKILDALAVEAASILDNARWVERERQRQRLEQELSIARDIQQALLPRDFRDFPHLAVAGKNSPCLAVGGDYFDVFPISDDRTAFLIADVSGKGLGAALLTTMLQGAFSGMTVGGDPARVFLHVNKFLCEHAEVGRYATMFFGILDRNGQLEYINAGHPPPLVLRRGEVAEPFTEGSFPVGLIPQANYFTARIHLESGDTLILFSDGVTEAMDPEEQMFGVNRLREVLVGQLDTPLDRLQKTVLESVEKFMRGASQADDITVLLVRYLSNAQPAPSQIIAT
jgi:sigma-B regulation protein RsbU (phosphoserine phosphatase)